MAQYTISNTLGGSLQALATTFKTITTLTAATATLRRAFIYDVLVGPSGPPNGTNDCEIIYQFSRQTAAGTSTTVTPTLNDPADAAAGTVGTVNFTAEGTITAASELLTIALNQRNSQRWVARDDKSRLVIPATNLNGIAGRAKSTNNTSNAIIDMAFDE